MGLRYARLLPERRRLPALLVAAVIAMTGGVWVASYAQRQAATRVAGEARTAELMLTAMLDQETGLRGFLLNRRTEFLEPYSSGRTNFEAAVAAARRASGDDPVARDLVDRQETIAGRWGALAEQQIVESRKHSFKPNVAAAFVRKSYMDRFRELNMSYEGLVEARRASQMDAAARVAEGVILGLGLVFSGFGMLLIKRAQRTRAREQEFAQSLQVMRSEVEAHELLRGHVERSVHGSRVTVLTRNNSADRLTASTGLDEADPLRAPLEHAVPGSCLALRLARTYVRDRGAEPLLQCDLCGKSAGASMCQPLLVGGEVLGAVLMRKTSTPTQAEGDRLAQSVSRAAPALANLRNLALAEARAQTDPLTNLANKRAIQDTIKRLHAHAARTGDPLSLIVVDLDHFKRINDTYGHDRGDEALAAAAEALTGTVRASDFVGRMGGEEFVVLLPATNADAATLVAEKLREAIRALRVTDLADGMTASFGVATFPEHAVETDALLRLADRALYLAKKLGRDRVEMAPRPGDRVPQSVATT
jgi:diguanylate cyclase (GGDEF)-like protein